MKHLSEADQMKIITKELRKQYTQQFKNAMTELSIYEEILPKTEKRIDEIKDRDIIFIEALIWAIDDIDHFQAEENIDSILDKIYQDDETSKELIRYCVENTILITEEEYNEVIELVEENGITVHMACNLAIK